MGTSGQSQKVMSLSDERELEGRLARVDDVLTENDEALVQRVLRVVREELDMDVAFLAEFDLDKQVYREIEGDAVSFGLKVDDSLLLSQSYCERLVSGTLSNIVPDAPHDPRVNHLPVTSGSQIGAYIGVPVVLPDGEVYGTLCALSHTPRRDLDERDVQFLRVLGRLITTRLQRRALETQNHRLELQAMGVDALLVALAARDGYTGDHSREVTQLARAVAHRLGLSEEKIMEVELGTQLHDLGKLAIPDAMLHKPERLSPEEWQVMYQHPIIGAEITASIESLAHLASIIRAEHERWDGSGYPDGLKGEEIPLASRIGFACDAYHAMVSDRPYRQAMTQAEATTELRLNAGTQFCPSTVAALLAVLETSDAVGRHG